MPATGTTDCNRVTAGNQPHQSINAVVDSRLLGLLTKLYIMRRAR